MNNPHPPLHRREQKQKAGLAWKLRQQEISPSRQICAECLNAIKTKRIKAVNLHMACKEKLLRMYRKYNS